jgi:hypothetical protein
MVFSVQDLEAAVRGDLIRNMREALEVAENRHDEAAN